MAQCMSSPEAHDSRMLHPQIGGSTAQMDLTLDLAEDERKISGSLNFSADLFQRSTIERMAGHLEAWIPARVHLQVWCHAAYEDAVSAFACARGKNMFEQSP